jgi:hypothetical protein
MMDPRLAEGFQDLDTAFQSDSFKNAFQYNLGLLDSEVGKALNTAAKASSVEEGMNPSRMAGDSSYLDHSYPVGRGFFGAMGQGFNEAFEGREGYVSKDGFFPGQTHVPYAREVDWTVNPAYGYTGPEENAYRLGRLGGAVVGNAYRSKVWNIHPADVMSTFGQGFAFKPGMGERFPGPRTFDTPGKFGEQTRFKGTREAAALATLTGTLGVEGILIGSGIYDPLNITEGMRPAGYQAVNPSEEDPRVSTNPALDVLQRYLFGRKGKLLPWEEFSQEKPNVSYEKYQEYKDWRFGEGNDPVRDLTMGLAQFTPSNLEGMPEFSMMGIGITPVGALAGAGGLLAGNALHSAMARRSLEEYKELQPKQLAGTATPDETNRLIDNPFARWDRYLNNKAWIPEAADERIIDHSTGYSVPTRAERIAAEKAAQKAAEKAALKAASRAL